MDYDDIAAHFLIASGAEPAPPDLPGTPARRLRDSVEVIATIGWWSRSAAEQVRGLGHDFFDGYVWGRAASLGADVDPSVVVSAFGVFAPELLVPVYQHARSVSTREQILEARTAGASAGLRAATGDVPAVDIGDAGDLLIDAVLSVEPGSRPLFAALQSLPVPDDPFGRLWRAAELVREHRGDTHLAACACAGLGRADMNVLTEVWLGYAVGEYSSTRGFSAEALAAAVSRLRDRGWIDDTGRLTANGREARLAIEAATDAGQKELIDAVGEHLDRVVESATRVSAGVLQASAAPADPRKRAAG